MRLTVLKNHVPIREVLVETPDYDERYEIYVGRSEDCHVVIEDPLISRHHFVLKNQNGKWQCERLSQLGTVSINGLSLEKMDLVEGDEIKCGHYAVIVSGLPVKIQVAQPHYTAPLPTQTPVYVAPIQIAVPEVAPVHLDEISSENKNDLIDQEKLTNEEIGPVSSLSDFSDNENLIPDENFDSDRSLSDGSSISSDGFSDNEVVTFDEGATEETEVDESTRFFKAFVNYQLVIFGEHAPYDRYLIESDEIFIGRDAKKCQIVLDDPEVSTVHAVIKKNNTDIVLEDLNSSNGTILNGERINKSQLVTGDEFVIGSTSFSLETRSDLLDAESDRLMPVESGQTIEKEEIEEEIVEMNEAGDVDFNSEAPPEKSLVARFRKDPAFRKKVIYGAVIAGVAYLFLGDSEPEKKSSTKAATTKVEDQKNIKEKKPKVELSKELQVKRDMAYELGVSFFEQSKYFEALKEFQTVVSIDPEYKKVDSYLIQTKEGLKRLEELESQKRAEEERIKTKKIVEELLVKAREAVKEKQIQLAENLFSQIAEKDPENIEVQQLKMELESWQKEQERLAIEKAAKESARKAMVDALSPGKTYYLKKEWYRAILKLEEYLRRKGTDEDLVKEASDMLSDAKNQLASELGPLVGKARSLKEGQDLKAAYEAYLDILKIEPTHSEALNEVDDIKSMLETRSKRAYREAIIAESLSLFGDAKEKFQEVQQISPSDSEYYRRAGEKLKNYLE